VHTSIALKKKKKKKKKKETLFIQIAQQNLKESLRKRKKKIYIYKVNHFIKLGFYFKRFLLEETSESPS
jgi:hypothetical protein